MATLGVVVVSFPGMKCLPQCLESVRWADRVMLFHVGDDEPIITESLASSVTLRRVRSPSEGKSADEEIRTDWILYLWGEERLEPKLQEELETIRRAAVSEMPKAFRIPIRSHVLGRWATGSLWGPSPALRLSWKGGRSLPTWWTTSEGNSHEAVGLLGGSISDYSSADLGAGFDRIQSVSGHWAEQLQTGNNDPGPGKISRRTLGVFTQVLILNRFVAHGLAGLTLSVLAAYATLLSGAKAWEKRHIKGKGYGDERPA